MTSIPPLPPRSTPGRRTGVLRWITGIALLAGSVGVGFDVRHALVQPQAVDALLQWEVTQYVRAGRDPYRVGNCVAAELAAEAAREGRPLHLYRIPADPAHGDDCGLLPEVGGPTATYPPSATALLTVLLGWLPRGAVLPVWAAVDLVALVLAAWMLCHWTARFGRGRLTFPECLAVLLALTATHLSVGNSQFSLPVLAALLLSLTRGRPWTAGIGLALALMKPSLALPMVLLFVIRRRWIALAVAAVGHLVAGAALCLMVGTDLWTLGRGWLQLSAYFTNGMYSLLELVRAAGIGSAVAQTGICLAFLAVAALWLYRNRRSSVAAQVEFLAVVSLWWTHHGTYDFVLLAPVVIGSLARWRLVGRATPGDVAQLGACVVLSLALPHAVVAGALPWHRALRWCGRLAVISLLAITASRLHGRGRPERPRGAAPPSPWETVATLSDKSAQVSTSG